MRMKRIIFHGVRYNLLFVIYFIFYMLFDTHCHLNFKRFDKNVDEVINSARAVGVTHITIPGTDIVSSQKAIDIAQKHDSIYAAVGIHPHHVYELLSVILNKSEGSLAHASLNKLRDSSAVLREIEELLQNDKVVAIGEIGLDRHIYEKTKYGEYHVDENFITLQKEFFIAQLALAKKYQKSVIVHNREAKQDLLPILREHWDSFFEHRMVLHCCEPDAELLQFAKDHRLFIGVDGDVTYWPEKAEFIKNVPLDMLVLETDSPFLLPEPLRTQKKFPNSPANLPLITEFVAKTRREDFEILKKQTVENAKKLYSLLV